MLEIAADAVLETFESLPQGRAAAIRMRSPKPVRRAVRAAVGQHWGKKPNVTVHVHLLLVLTPAGGSSLIHDPAGLLED